MRVGRLLAPAAGLLIIVACGNEVPAAEPQAESGVTGSVHLGPQCPVESPDDPCEDKPASGVTVIVSEHSR